jgi:glutathione S-transferase
MTDMTLYIGNKNYSSWSLRPWLAMKQAGLSFREVLVPLNQADTQKQIKAFSGSGKVPLLEHGAVKVWESLAICEYVAELRPQAHLWPSDPAARAHARAVATEMHGGFAELRRNMPMDIRGRWPERNRQSHCAAEIERVIAIWHEARERFGKAGANGKGDFLFGGFTIADAMYAPVTTRFITYGAKFDAATMAYIAAINSLPAMREWAEAAKQEPWELTYPVFRQA